MIGRALVFAMVCWPMVASAQVRDGANAAARPSDWSHNRRDRERRG
jgi:hypothetical protein